MFKVYDVGLRGIGAKDFWSDRHTRFSGFTVCICVECRVQGSKGNGARILAASYGNLENEDDLLGVPADFAVQTFVRRQCMHIM